MNTLLPLLLVLLPVLVLSNNSQMQVGRSVQKAVIQAGNITPIEQPFKRVDGCWPGFSPVANQVLDTCCWYNGATCCSIPIATQIMPQFMSDMKNIYAELGAKTQCYAAIASFLCFMCAPNTGAFISGDPAGSVKINLCTTYCDALYYACKNDLGKLFPDPTVVKSGNDFCKAAFASDPDTTSNEGVIFDSNLDSDCFAGFDLDEVENSGCLPGVKPPSRKQSKQYEKVIGGLVGVIALLLLVIAGMVGIFIYKKIQQRRRAVPTGRDFSLLNDTEDDGMN